MNRAEWWLVLVLRISACVLFLALGGVVMPFAWMNAAHEAMGLGTLPDMPIIHYLTRSLSGLYFYHGGVMLLASFDVRRYRSLVLYVAAGNIVGGIFLLVLDCLVHMPLFWTLL